MSFDDAGRSPAPHRRSPAGDAIESEIKLEFDTADAARAAIARAGGRLVVARRRLDDTLFDFADGRLGASDRALRLRRDGGAGLLTVKGPARPGPVKAREERELTVADADETEALLRLLGCTPCFRAGKHREEYRLGDARVTVDETEIGIFVEIEAPPATIDAVATRLGRARSNYILASYPALYRQRRRPADR